MKNNITFVYYKKERRGQVDERVIKRRALAKEGIFLFPIVHHNII